MEKENNKLLHLKDFEFILWILPGIIIFLFYLTGFGLDYILRDIGVSFEVIMGFSPVLFAFLFYFIYESFPINYLISLLRKRK